MENNVFTMRTSKNYSATKTIRQLAMRHLIDQFHSTSDDELINATIEFSIPTPVVPNQKMNAGEVAVNSLVNISFKEIIG